MAEMPLEAKRVPAVDRLTVKAKTDHANMGWKHEGGSQPLITQIGRRRATFFEMPAPCTVSTTWSMSL
jgi:hypothetical protein